MWAAGALQDLGQQLLLGVDAAGDEAGAGAEGELSAESGASREPCGVLGERVPRREVGEAWPLVRP